MHVQSYQRIWLFRTRGKIGEKERIHVGSSIIRHSIALVAILGIVLVGSGTGTPTMGVFAKSLCTSGDQVYSVVSGDTLGGIELFVFLAKYDQLASLHLSSRLSSTRLVLQSKALTIIFLTASVHGGQVIVIFNYTASMCHGKRKRTPGNGQPAQETSTGMFLALHHRVLLLTCNHG